ncbi:MAG: peptide deformylase [Bacteroidales bacterium]|nr:peptide deformylase [Bacteroidales bacterium]
MAEHEIIETKAVPIIAYGNKILRQSCNKVSEKNNGLNRLIDALWNTLETSGGVGLAAPQINSSDKVFVVNSKLMYDDLPDAQKQTWFSGDKGIVETFINARIIAESEENWSESEGCLSIPGIVKPVERSWEIIVEYFDRNFKPKRVQFSGFTAKVILHEYDHTNGILFIDHLPALSKKLLSAKLKQIASGRVTVDYPIKFLKHS